jgi:hypothetical protein
VEMRHHNSDQNPMSNAMIPPQICLTGGGGVIKSLVVWMYCWNVYKRNRVHPSALQDHREQERVPLLKHLDPFY